MGSCREWQTNQNTAVTNREVLCFRVGSVLPYRREIYSLNLLLESQGEKERQSSGPGMMRGPIWGGPQAAAKRHPQSFSGERLPHPRVVCQPTKPVITMDRSRMSLGGGVESGVTARGAFCVLRRGSTLSTHEYVRCIQSCIQSAP